MSKDKSEQRGTLLVEALAMLGLIAMVTPTLYKKSAERLQEIQDINIASQARMMNGIIETFINNHKTEFVDTSGSSTVYQLCYSGYCNSDEDKNSKISGISPFSTGYSSIVPAGFKPDDVKYFQKPRVVVVSDAKTHNLVYYIIYPKSTDVGARRAARLASLIGSNGGFVKDVSSVAGVGSSWVIDETLIKNYKLPVGFQNLLTENTLAMTNTEAISTKQTDNDKYLWREFPGEVSHSFHNTMITDLYLGGNSDEEHVEPAMEYYSIFNVRKLTLNTRCSAFDIFSSDANNEGCQDFQSQVADLYIGKPTGKLLQYPTAGNTEGIQTNATKNYQANTGAAWIYGNLSALENRFKLFNTDGASVDRNGYDVMEFAREEVKDADDKVTLRGMEVLKATNEENNAEVRFINGHVRAIENGTYGSTHASTNGPAFYVGGNVDSTEVEGRQIAAFRAGDKDVVMINDVASNNTETYINRQGGVVHINGSSKTTDAGTTYVNEEGGYLIAGKDGRWLRAEGEGTDTPKVMMLYDSSSKVPAHGSFSVAGGAVDSSAVWANSQMVSLYGGAIRAYQGTRNFKDKNIGGSAAIAQYEQGLDNEAKLGSTLTGGAVLAAKYTDILGDTYVGAKEMSSKIDDSLPFERDKWKLGVAGSAWVDELLFANEAWFNSSGFRELHAGFSSYGDFQKNPRRGWLNAYSDGVSIGNSNKHENTAVGGVDALNTRFFADKDQVYLGDSSGGMAYIKEGFAQLGYAYSSAPTSPINYVGADSSKAMVVGKELVDLQRGALLLKGHSMDSSESQHNYSANIVEAHASDFEVYTKDVTASAASSKAQFRVNGDSAVVQHIDFAVRDSSTTTNAEGKTDATGKARFLVQPDEDRWQDNKAAHVTVDGSFHVTGNKVMHVASNENNVADKDGSHAMFEIDPTAIKVMAMKQVKDDVYDIDSSRSMILKINPTDIDGARIVKSEDSSAIVGGGANQASIYIRKGAIELMHDDNSSRTWAADQGFGYIKADRLVVDSSIVAPHWEKENPDPYDQYMVNPAYTSVMHDIKLTTRGGARLSDILPDYILKGVYIVANDFLEGKQIRIRWSAGDYYCNRAEKGDLLGDVKCTNDTVKVAWADPYVGVVPFAPCPRGYKNMATITPTSFQMAQAGEVTKPSTLGAIQGTTLGKYVINPKPRYIDILNAAGGGELVFPVYNEVKTLVARHSVNAAGIDEPYQSSKTAGWFLGFKAEYKDDGTPDGDLVSNLDSSNIWTPKFIKNNTTANYIAEPLSFQQNTFLKTALGEIYEKDGVKKGWKAYMGFLYDLKEYQTKNFGDGVGQFVSQTNTEDSTTTGWGDFKYFWNVFPVPTNTIEGYAHVYCYFDRTEFLGEDLKGEGDHSKWKNVIDPIDQLSEDWHKNGGRNKNSNTDYQNRLNDPKLKYKDPW